jgi:Zinc-binding dehydrogenase
MSARYDWPFRLGGTYSPAAVRKVLTPHGKLILSFGDGNRWFGPVGNIIKAVALNPFVGQTLKSFTAQVTRQALKEVGDLIESGRITLVIDRAYPLTDAAAAVRLVEEGSPRARSSLLLKHRRTSRHPSNPRRPSANTGLRNEFPASPGPCRRRALMSLTPRAHCRSSWPRGWQVDWQSGLVPMAPVRAGRPVGLRRELARRVAVCVRRRGSLRHSSRPR